MSIVLLGIEAPTPRDDTDRLNALLLTRGRRDNFCPRRHSREDEPDEPQAVECRCDCGCATRIWEIDSAAASISSRQDATRKAFHGRQDRGVLRQTASSARAAGTSAQRV